MFNTNWDQVRLSDEKEALIEMLVVAISGQGDRTKLEAWWDRYQRSKATFYKGEKVYYPMLFGYEICEVVKVYHGSTSQPPSYSIKAPSSEYVRPASAEHLEKIEFGQN